MSIPFILFWNMIPLYFSKNNTKKKEDIKYLTLAESQLFFLAS